MTGLLLLAALGAANASEPVRPPQAAAYESVCSDMLLRGAAGAAPVCSRCLELEPGNIACGAPAPQAAPPPAPPVAAPLPPAPAAPVVSPTPVVQPVYSITELAKRCEKALEAKDYVQAESDCRKCLDTDPSHAACKTAYYSIGSRAARAQCRKAVEAQEAAKIQEYCKRCLAIDDTDVACMLGLKSAPRQENK